MKRKVTLFFLLLFAAVQIYFAKRPLAHQVAGSSWIQVTHATGGLVARQGTYYVVGADALFRLKASSVRIEAEPVPVTWEEVPQPAGGGVWKVAYTDRGVPLTGSGGPVMPSPDGHQVIWQDPRTGRLFESGGLGSSLTPLKMPVRRVKRLLWAPDGAALAVLGTGPHGEGLYVYDGDRTLTLVLRGPQAQAIRAFGFTREETLVVALANGSLWWQGHPEAPLGYTGPVYVDNGSAAAWGLKEGQTLWWQAGTSRLRTAPVIRFEGSAQFSPQGGEVAVLAEEGPKETAVYIEGTDGQSTVRLPFDLAAQAYRLLGFVGRHWILVEVTGGEHAGIYGWWTNGTKGGGTS